jgi:hypothetical protein
MRPSERLRLRTPLPNEPVVRDWDEAPPNVRQAYALMALAWLRARALPPAADEPALHVERGD